jgi:hypothetical protein
VGRAGLRHFWAQRKNKLGGPICMLYLTSNADTAYMQNIFDKKFKTQPAASAFTDSIQMTPSA